LIAAIARGRGRVANGARPTGRNRLQHVSRPANANDPRAAAQTKVLAEFERLNPNIKVRVVVDPPGSNGARALRTRADSPDVIRATNFQMPEYVATGSLMQLDELVARDKIDPNDWLVPLSKTMVRGHIYGLQQDYRIRS
jgi:ABC-type glycerol-3-phosphate transport system substrate-binding protein